MASTPTRPSSTQSSLRKCHDCYAVTRTAYSRCARCRKKRRASDRKYRTGLNRAVFPLALRKEVLLLIRLGRTFTQVEKATGLTSPLIHGFTKKNPWFRADLDKALMAGRDPNLKHGSATTYRRQGCRCPECRAAKRKSGAWTGT